jgi:hypothetical protein
MAILDWQKNTRQLTKDQEKNMTEGEKEMLKS